MITFILGCALGSFTDCLAGRMLNGTSVLKGRSHCDACGHVLGVLDLVPLFSRLCLRGRCRYCGAKIPAEAFWTELVSGIACCLIMYRYDVSVLALRGILLWMVLLCLTLTDLHAWIIPDRLQIAGILIFFGTALGLPEPGRQMLRGVLTGAGLAVSMLALSLLFDRLTGKESLGGGDVKLFFCDGTVYAFRLGGIIFPDSQLCAGNCRFCHRSEGENSVWTGDCGGMFLYAAVWRYMDTMVYRALLKGVQR